MARGMVKKRGRTWTAIYREPDGTQKWKGGFERQKLAEDFLREVLGDVRDGTYQKLRDRTFDDYADYWLKAETVGLKPATVAEWESHLRNHLIPEFGPLRLQQISRERIQRYVARLVEEKKLKPKSIRNIFVPLHRMLRDAVTGNYLRINPASGVKKPVKDKKKVKEGRDFLHPKELDRLFVHAEPYYRTLFYMAAVTGIRQGELLALRRSDLQDGKVTVERTLHWSKNNGVDPRWVFHAPKSEASMRDVDIGRELMGMLKRHMLLAPPSEHDLIFPNQDGGPMDPKNMMHRHFNPALRRAKLRHVDFHSLRHSYAAMQIKNNVSLKYLQAQLGHASIEVTLDVYGHLLPGVGEGTADKVEALLANKMLTKGQRLR